MVSISKQYPWLTEKITLNHRKPRLSSKDFKDLSLEHQNFLSNNWYDIFKLTQKEWKVRYIDENYQHQKIDCELCGQKDLDSISVIENIHNGIKLKVGSTCIKKFIDIENNSIEDRKKYEKAKKEKEKILLNKEYCETNVNGILQLINDFNAVSKDKSIILNNLLQNEYNKVNRIIDEDYNQQLTIAKNKINIKKIECVFSFIKDFMNKLNIYLKDCKEKEWGIKPEIAVWCHNSNNTQLIQSLQNFGEINIYTVDKIYEPNYLKNTVLKFKELFELNNIILNSNNSDSFNITLKNRMDISLKVNTVNFIELKKDYLFENNTDINLNKLLNISTIIKSSYFNVVNTLLQSKEFNRLFKIFFEDTGINELAFLNKNDNMIYTVNYKKFIQFVKYFIFENKITNFQINQIINFVKSNAIKYNKTDYAEHLLLYNIKLNKKESVKNYIH